MIHISWIFKHLFYLRIAFLKKKILLDIQSNENQDITILDLGSGDGQFAFFANHKFRNCRIFCEDIETANCTFIKKYAHKNQIERVCCMDFASINIELKFDRIWIFSLLQYVENEVEFLEKVRKRINVSGKILLYVPINHNKRGWLYMILFHSFNHYESFNQRKRVYSYQQLLELFQIAGFEIEQHEFICSKLGIRAQEWLSNALMLLGSKHFGTKFLGLCYLSLAALPILMWKWADRFSEKNSLNSNAVYFELKKT